MPLLSLLPSRLIHVLFVQPLMFLVLPLLELLSFLVLLLLELLLLLLIFPVSL